MKDEQPRGHLSLYQKCLLKSLLSPQAGWSHSTVASKSCGLFLCCFLLQGHGSKRIDVGVLEVILVVGEAWSLGPL